MSALPGASLYILFPGFGPHRSHISKTKHFTMYLCWEAKAVFQGGWFLILIFSHVQPIEYMVIISDKLEFTVIDSMLLKTK